MRQAEFAQSPWDNTMKLEMISTGEEVLAGQIVDTNAAWFGDAMMAVGVEMQRRFTVGDRLDDLADLFQERSHHADIILVNGGLGPTSDDLSALAMAKAKGEDLIECPAWRQRLESWFSQRNRPMPASNVKQAMLPASAVMVDNPVGTACGFRVKLNRAWLFFTPGVPAEFKTMVQQQFIPFIRSEFDLGDPVTVHKLLTFGYGESLLADRLESLAPPSGITLGYRSHLPYIEIKLFARGHAQQVLPAFSERVKAALGDALVSETQPTLAAEVHDLLSRAGLTLSLAESCTGGMLASQLVDFPGSSRYLHQGLVTYSDAAKIKLLGVSPRTLQQHGAVSLATAKEMAQGARELLNSDFALSTSGIAGPSGGSEEKPVGTVALALATRKHTYAQLVKLPARSREWIRLFSSAIAFDMLRRALLGTPPLADYPMVQRIDR